MKQLYKELLEQPEHVRELFMWVMVVITFSVIGFSWFRSTQKEFVALVNPELRDTAVAEKATDLPSPVATLWSSVRNLRGSFSELLSLRGTDVELVNATEEKAEEIPPQKLPLSN